MNFESLEGAADYNHQRDREYIPSHLSPCIQSHLDSPGHMWPCLSQPDPAEAYNVVCNRRTFVEFRIRNLQKVKSRDGGKI